jgi:hypothetical protein
MNDLVHDLEELELDLKEASRLLIVHRVRHLEQLAKESNSQTEIQSPSLEQ